MHAYLKGETSPSEAVALSRSMKVPDVQYATSGGVHIASRVAESGVAGEILTSGTVRDLSVGSQISFEDRGEKHFRGVSDAWRIYAVNTDPGPIGEPGVGARLSSRAALGAREGPS